MISGAAGMRIGWNYMTVRELMANLADGDPDALVVTCCPHFGDLVFLSPSDFEFCPKQFRNHACEDKTISAMVVRNFDFGPEPE